MTRTAFNKSPAVLTVTAGYIGLVCTITATSLPEAALHPQPGASTHPHPALPQKKEACDVWMHRAKIYQA